MFLQQQYTNNWLLPCGRAFGFFIINVKYTKKDNVIKKFNLISIMVQIFVKSFFMTKIFS